MTGASYTPGTWLGIVRDRTAVLLGPGAPAELAGALWELLAGRPEPHEVLAAVTSSSGGSLTHIPSFGILDFNGSLRVFLRGDIDLTVEQPGGAVDLDGRDVTTWNERRFVMPGTCRVDVPASGAGALRQVAEEPGMPLGGLPPTGLPLGDGVVLLQSLTLGVPSGPAAVSGPAVSAPAAAHGAGAGDAFGGADAPFAVNAAGEVDSPAEANGHMEADRPAEANRPAEASGHAEESSAAAAGTVAAEAADPDEDPSGRPAASAPGPQDVPLEPEDLSRVTLLPHEVSTETMVGVIDEGPDEDRPENEDLSPAPAVANLDPDATIAPGAIIDVDDEPAGQPVSPEAEGIDPEEPVTGAGDAATAVEMTSSYDHLWDRTVMRNIEDAAVREEPDADSGQVSAQVQPALPAAERLPALETAQGAAPEEPATATGGSADARTGQPTTAGAGSTAETPAPPRPASTGLIDSVPWRTGGSTPAASAPAPVPPPTLGTPPAPAAHAPVPFDGGPAGSAREAPPAEPGAGFDPDHDGQTVMKSSLPGTGSGPAPSAPSAQQDAAGGPLVLARVCAQGHANPPTRAQCSACGAALLPDAVQVARPRLGRVRLSTGELLDLDQSMVIGRQPSVSRVQGGVMPRLVQVASPGGDISRSHVEVRLEGWHVMLCDLKATNGTVLVREGQPPRRLAQNEMAILLDGDIAELGDNISLRFEEIP
jgi:hypothetical protein